MSEELNLDITELRRHRRDNGTSSGQNGERSGPRAQSRHGSTRVTGTGAPYVDPPPSSAARASAQPFNLWRWLEVLLRRWSWIVLAALGCGGLAFVAGLALTSYAAKVSLIRRENPNAFTAGTDSLAPQAYLSRELSPQTLYALMRSPEVFRRASEKTQPPARPEQLAEGFRVIPERNADFVTLALSGKQSKAVLASWANVCADEVVQYTKELQAKEAGSIAEFLSLKLQGVREQLAQINSEMAAFSEQAQSLDVDKEVEAYMAKLVDVETKAETARIERDALDRRVQLFRRALAEQSPSNDRLQAAQEEMERLRARGYTDLHPEIVRQKAVIEAAQQQQAAPLPKGTDLRSRPGVGTFANSIQFEILQLQGLKEVRDREVSEYESLKHRMQEKAKSLSKTAVQYAQLKAGQRRMEDLRITLLNKQQEFHLLKENALGYFRIHAYASPEQVSGRKRWVAVILLAGVGALLGMLAAAGLALITEVMDTRIRTAADVERVTGLPLLARLGDLRQMGPEEQMNWAFRTLTILQGRLNDSSDETLVCGIISSNHGEGRSTWINLLVRAASQRGMRVLTVATRASSPAEETPEQPMRKPAALLPAATTTTLTKSVLAHPAQVAEQFSDPQAQPVVHIPLPGWVWNLERRQQWRTALEHWQDISNLVLLIELPPASQPESVLLAEHLPQVIWLTSSGMATIEETRAQLDTLRHARCNLVGAVINREPTSFLRRTFGRWSGRLSSLLLAVTACALAEGAQPERIQAAAAPVSFAAKSPVKRAAWQERLTLGPGDSLDIAIYGRPELTRTNVVVGPDGRLSYLHLQDLPVAGLTIDELRNRFDSELARFYVTPRTMVAPVSFNSKKYYVLGKVANEGVFVLDRPLTIIEAVARAKGLQTASGQGSGQVADLSRSFLVRDGKKVPISLEKLFLQGDLSQNALLEPGDYLYIAPNAVREIFILGEVFSPGALGVGESASLITALTARGGFTERAWRKRVLVVRGSLQQPEAFAVDAPAILAGRTPDFRLQPGDVVYVNARPWIRVEELLDIATQSFIEAAVTTWVGGNVPAVFTKPIIPSL